MSDQLRDEIDLLRSRLERSEELRDRGRSQCMELETELRNEKASSGQVIQSHKDTIRELREVIEQVNGKVEKLTAERDTLKAACQRTKKKLRLQYQRHFLPAINTWKERAMAAEADRDQWKSTAQRIADESEAHAELQSTLSRECTKHLGRITELEARLDTQYRLSENLKIALIKSGGAMV